MTAREIHAVYVELARRHGLPESDIISYWDDLTPEQQAAYYSDALNIALEIAASKSTEGSDQT